MIDEPYFMTNEKWYFYDYDEKKYKLADNVSKKVKDSYEEYYNELEGEINGKRLNADRRQLQSSH